MGMIDRLLSRPSASEDLKKRDPSEDYWYRPLSRPVAAGVTVTVQKALTLPVVYDCCQVLSQTTGTLPWGIFERKPDGSKARRDQHPLVTVFADPNPETTTGEFFGQIVFDLATEGDAFLEIEAGDLGPITYLWRLDPCRMLVERLSDGSRRYTYTEDSGQPRTLLDDDVWHLRALPLRDGLRGTSRIWTGRESIGAALALRDYAARFFGNDATPPFVIEHPSHFKDGESRKNYLAAIKRWWGGERRHSPGILEHGMKLNRVGVNNEEAQFLECVVPGTLVTMADGTRRPVETLKPGDRVMGWDKGQIVAARVAHVGTPPVKPLVRIRTARGRELTATADHPVLARPYLRTPGGRRAKDNEQWVAMGDLRKGHYVRVALGALEQESGGLSFDEAYFLGAMAGNGYVRKTSCSFSTGEPLVAERVAASMTGRDGSLKRIPGSSYDWTLVMGKTGSRPSPIRSLLQSASLVGKHSHDKTVPEIVVHDGPAAWRGFLSGYMDTDGSVRDPLGQQKPAAAWTSTSKELLDGCQHLLALLGIQSAIYPVSDPGPKTIGGVPSAARACWALYVMGVSQLSRLANALDLGHPEKRKRLAGYLNAAPSRYGDANFDYDRVVLVERVGPGETVGVEVEGCHTHVTGGIITHNTRKELSYEIAQLWRMPPHKVGLLDRATNNNIEHQSLEFVMDTLLPWLELIEQSVRKYLIVGRERLFFEFNVSGLLRGDLKGRYDAYAQGRQWGWLSVNDVRKLENMNPIAGGDAYLQPLNMVPAGSPPRQKPDASILGPNGQPVSLIFGENVVRLSEHRRPPADVRQTMERLRHAA